MKNPVRKHEPAPLVFERASEEDLANFDPSTKVCSMNCGPHMDDPRSEDERRFLCQECYVYSKDDMKKREMKVEWRPAALLRPYDKNARIHTPQQLDAIAASIKAAGWTKPIIVDERDMILAGHGAWMAARQMGETDVPCIVRRNLTQAQKRAYIIADNRTAEISTWDKAILAGELADLKGMGIDLDTTGWDAAAITLMLTPPPGPDDDPPEPELHEKATARPGDIWQMGNHRIVCGDCTDPTIMGRLMDGMQADMVFTDPPYGVSYQDGGGRFEVIKGDDKRRGALRKLLNDSFAMAVKHARQDAAWYVWHASSAHADFYQALTQNGLVELGYIIWVKPTAVMGWSDYRWAHEPCFYAARQGMAPPFYGDRAQVTVWKINVPKTKTGRAMTKIGTGVMVSAGDGREIYVTQKPPAGKKVRDVRITEAGTALLEHETDSSSVWEVGRDHGQGDSVHPNQKPIELARKAIRNSTKDGELVLDMFAGSGITVIGCEQLGRAAYVAEFDPLYVDATIERWQTMTKQQAVLAQGLVKKEL